MTDQELIRAAAEAMGWTFVPAGDAPNGVWRAGHYVQDGKIIAWEHNYDPLHDDAQAMALVKKFRLEIADVERNDYSHEWGVSYIAPDYGSRDTDFQEPPHARHVQGFDADLNRAIVSCVAKLKSL